MQQRSSPGRRPRLFVLSELYYPEETSTGYFVTRIAEGLAQVLPTTAICSQPTYSRRGTRAKREETRHGVLILRSRSTVLDKNVFVLRLLNFATTSLSIFATALRRIRRNDIVLVVTNPPLLPFMAAIACRLRGARLVLLIHDVYPDVMVAAGLMGASSAPRRMWDALTRRLYAFAHRIIVLGRDMETRVCGKLERIADRVLVIGHWADLDEVVPLPRESNPLLRTLGLESKFVVQYAGNIGRTHDIEVLVEAAEALAADYSDVHFLFIGSGAKKDWLVQQVRVRGLTNVTVLDSVPRSDLTVMLNACDVAVISFVKGMAGVSVASRMYNILAAGRPIIAVADEDSELALVVREEAVGWQVSSHCPRAVVDAVLAARADPQARLKMGRRSRKAAEEKYSFAGVLEAYIAAMEQLIAQGQSASPDSEREVRVSRS